MHIIALRTSTCRDCCNSGRWNLNNIDSMSKLKNKLKDLIQVDFVHIEGIQGEPDK